MMTMLKKNNGDKGEEIVGGNDDKTDTENKL